MSDIALRVEGLGKQYRLAHKRPHDSLKEAMVDGFRALTRRGSSSKANSEETFWALKDVSFEVKKGEVLGIIGRNGAGKSTLLKILSRITEMTEGAVDIHGRIGSLLEVGTGFHHELTGRENIFLNGAIMGMTQAEVRRKFDEIVAFSEIEKFLDTPVKHYSSGMYTRLAFAVAAHLEPAILIIDEVLAVGDAQFQKKCLGKMDDVAREGRTVLFVSHQMGSVSQLCNQVLCMDRGRVAFQGEKQAGIALYLDQLSQQKEQTFTGKDDAPDKPMAILRAHTSGEDGVPRTDFTHLQTIELHVTCLVRKRIRGTIMGFYLVDHRGRKVFTSQNDHWDRLVTSGGEVEAVGRIPGHFLVPGQYACTLAISIPFQEVIVLLQDAVPINVVDGGSDYAQHEGTDFGCVFAPVQWSGTTVAP